MNPEKFFKPGSKFITKAVINKESGSINVNVIFNDEYKTAEILQIEFDSSFPSCDILTTDVADVVEGFDTITIESINNDEAFKIYKIMQTDHPGIKRIQLTYD